MVIVFVGVRFMFCWWVKSGSRSGCRGGVYSGAVLDGMVDCVDKLFGSSVMSVVNGNEVFGYLAVAKNQSNHKEIIADSSVYVWKG